jgi:SAM-dependent methyltransferase
MPLKSLVKSITPEWLLQRRRTYAVNRANRRFSAMSTPEIFESIYRDAEWGADGVDGFSSGLGSHDPVVVEPYVTAVRSFLSGLGDPPDVVDLGCGDFNVGSQLRDACARYVAGDVASNVIERNRERFAELAVDFRVVNIADDPLPEGDVVFVRQVLQHLDNAQIARVVPKLTAYRWAVVTEHLPCEDEFVPNRDKPTGPGIRTDLASGVVLDAPPFDLRAAETQELCVVRHESGTFTTTAYRFD